MIKQLDSYGMNDIVVRSAPAADSPERGENGSAENAAAAEARALRQLAPSLHLQAHVAGGRRTRDAERVAQLTAQRFRLLDTHEVRADQTGLEQST